MQELRTAQALAALQAFAQTDLANLLREHATRDPAPHLLELFHRYART